MQPVSEFVFNLSDESASAYRLPKNLSLIHGTGLREEFNLNFNAIFERTKLTSFCIILYNFININFIYF